MGGWSESWDATIAPAHSHASGPRLYSSRHNGNQNTDRLRLKLACGTNVTPLAKQHPISRVLVGGLTWAPEAQRQEEGRVRCARAARLCTPGWARSRVRWVPAWRTLSRNQMNQMTGSSRPLSRESLSPPLRARASAFRFPDDRGRGIRDGALFVCVDATGYAALGAVVRRITGCAVACTARSFVDIWNLQRKAYR